MSKRSIEETFKAVKPKGRRGIPNPPTIGVGVSGDNGDLSASLSQAVQQITQLQAAYQQQASLIQSNTQAIQGNTIGAEQPLRIERGGRCGVEPPGRVWACFRR